MPPFAGVGGTTGGGKQLGMTDSGAGGGQWGRCARAALSEMWPTILVEISNFHR